MRSIPFVTVDVFTDRRFGGNPLAVFPDARGLSDSDMQSLAREFNLSETTFVLPPEDLAHTARVRIFNTSHEMAFAGHPNVGTGAVLASRNAELGDLLHFEEPAGVVEVRIERASNGAVLGAEIASPQALCVMLELAPELVAPCAGLRPTDIRLGLHAPVLATVGNPMVLAQIDAAALASATPDHAAFRALVERTPELQGRLGLYLYAHHAGSVRARMFSPLDGTWEDPATGSAATTLAALLLSRTQSPHATYEILQGAEMGRPSRLRAAARRCRDGIRATVAGRCVPVLHGEAVLDNEAVGSP